MVDRGFDQWLCACKLDDYSRSTRYELEMLECYHITGAGGLPRIGVTPAPYSLKCHGVSRSPRRVEHSIMLQASLSLNIAFVRPI